MSRRLAWLATLGCVFLSSCTAPVSQEPVTSAQLDGETFENTGEIIARIHCSESAGVYHHSAPGLADSAWALQLAKAEALSLLGPGVEVSGVLRVGDEIWAIIGGDDLVIGAVEDGQDIKLCID